MISRLFTIQRHLWMTLLLGLAVSVQAASQAQKQNPAPKASAPASKASTPALEQLDQKAWLDQYKSNFSTLFCSKADFLATCANSDPSKCKKSVTNNLVPCSKEEQLPNRLTLGEESEFFGAKLGRCLTRKMISETKLEENPKCKNLSAW